MCRKLTKGVEDKEIFAKDQQSWSSTLRIFFDRVLEVGVPKDGIFTKFGSLFPIWISYRHWVGRGIEIIETYPDRLHLVTDHLWSNSLLILGINTCIHSHEFNAVAHKGKENLYQINGRKTLPPHLMLISPHRRVLRRENRGWHQLLFTNQKKKIKF